MKLHLGCSDNLMPGWLNVDLFAPPSVRMQDSVVHGHADTPGGRASFMRADLNDRWPFEDSSAEAILAHDVFEHVHGHMFGNGGKIHVMNEAWRVLKPGGVLDMTVPSFLLSDGRVNPGAVADPTHATWWTLDDQYYFSEQFNTDRVEGTYGGRIEAGERGRLGPAYGITARFRFPRVTQNLDGTWFKSEVGWAVNPLGIFRHVWKMREDAEGARAKIIGLLEAVK
jgi:SAM-dependent methyltransferase